MSERVVRVPTWFASLAVGFAIGGVVALQTYTIRELSAVKEHLAALTAVMNAHIKGSDLAQK